MNQILKIISCNEKDLPIPNKGTYMIKINVLEVARVPYFIKING
jgi:hypothetical protein